MLNGNLFEEEENTLSKHNILIVTCALLLSNAMSGLDSTIINTALPAIISDLHGIELMGWIVAVFLLGTAVSTPLWSKLGEHLGNQVSYQIAALLFVVGSLLQGLSTNITFFNYYADHCRYWKWWHDLVTLYYLRNDV